MKIKIMTISAILLSTLFISSCFLPAGQLKDSDFIWQKQEISENPEKILNKIKIGFRKCGTTAPNGTAIGYLECINMTDKNILCDVYAFRENPLVIGKLTIDENQNISSVKAGVITSFDSTLSSKKGATRQAWLDFVKADYSVCNQVENTNTKDSDFE